MLWLIIGGGEQGKLVLASRQYEDQIGQAPQVVDAELLAQDTTDKKLLIEQLKALLNYDIVDHIHLFLRHISRVCDQADYDEVIENLLQDLRTRHNEQAETNRMQMIIIDDIGSGVVPLDYEDRLWRERCGRLYCQLTAEACTVQRVWAGIAQTIKRELK
ncbi:MAG: hypothetical protein GX028_00775 [Clostridiaceae bacterium]|nr:hypothetical protein [Clostridiaceae bacterium]